MNIKNISCGANHCLALEGAQGLVFSWGNGLGGRLGHGDETGENFPKEVAFFRENNVRVLSIQGGEANSAAITNKNELLIWGVGLCGRLGTGKTQNALLPTLIEDLKNVKVEELSLGSNHTLCVLRNGKVLCWGSSKDGKMGLDTANDRNFLTPKDLIALERERVYQVSAGPFHSMALTENGEIYTFGHHKDGKLGFEESKLVPLPRKISQCPVFQKKFGAVEDRNKRFPLFQDYDESYVLVPKDDSTTQPTEVLQIAVGASLFTSFSAGNKTQCYFSTTAACSVLAETSTGRWELKRAAASQTRLNQALSTPSS